MDRAQEFIKTCLFTRNFDNPNKPIEENRLQETLLLLPTDGGVSSRIKHNKKKTKINSQTLNNVDTESIIHPNYRSINKNSKTALRDYIRACKMNTAKALRIAHEKQLHTKETLNAYLQENEPKLWKNMVNYSSFLPMHDNLWLSYIKEVLGISPELKDPSEIKMNGSNALVKLSMADYNGAFLTVVKSVNKNTIGVKGIVIWDSQKNFILVTNGTIVDSIKIIPKKGSVFNLEIPLNDDSALLYTLLGDRFQYRSSDRAGRKFKSRKCDDLLYYINNM